VADERCRVTVIGIRNQADVAVPARLPVGEYAYALAATLQEHDSDGMPAAWSLKVPGRPPLPPFASLDMAGVTDGQVLYLCDLAEGEYDEPLVLEVSECVAETVERMGNRRWTVGSAARAALVLSVAWAVASSASWLLTEQSHGTVAGLLALLAGVALIVTAWLGQAERFGFTRMLRLALAMSAVPCLAVTGWFAGLGSSGGHHASGHALAVAVAGLAVGAAAGALAAMAAMPGIETVSLAVLATLAAAGACALSLSGATAAQAAAVTAAAGYWLVVLAPSLAVRVAATWEQLSREEDTEQTVVFARGLTLAGTYIGAVAVAASLVLLAAAGSPYALALAGVVAAAMLLRAATCKLLIEAMPIVIAGLAGLFALLMLAPRDLGGGRIVPVLAEWPVGLVLLILGVTGTVAWSARQGAAQDQPPAPRSLAVPRKRQAALRGALTLFSVAVLPLVLGTFGIYAQLTSVGHHL
jgi:hypothetical protein